MRTMLCFFAQEMSSEQEKLVLNYDNEETEIHLYTDTLKMQAGAGFLLQQYDLLVTDDSDSAYFCSDRMQLCAEVRNLYPNLFDEVICCENAFCGWNEKSKCYTEADIAILRDIIKSVHQLKVMCYDSDCEMGFKEAAFLFEGLQKTADMASELVEQLSDCGKNYFNEWLWEYIGDEQNENRIFRIYMCGLLMKYFPNREYNGISLLYKELQNSCYDKNNRYFIYQLIRRFSFVHPNVKIEVDLDAMYDVIVEEWRTFLAPFLKPLEKNKRNRDRVVVLSVQFLSEAHAPTHTALERIYTLGKCFGKEVLCINTREKYALNGFLPIFDASGRQIDKGLNGFCRIAYKDYTVPFYQPACEMPDLQEYIKLLQLIREFAPYEIVVVGVDSILGDLCADMIPTICIPWVFSSIPKKHHQFVATGKQINEEERKHLAAAGYETERIIESIFTFELKPQKTVLKREELKLPADRFLIIMVGTRLHYDITEEFLKEILPLAEKGAFFVFAGYFENYEQLCEKFTMLAQNSQFLGYQEDITALMELCDLYLNPPRLGGGFSVIEAFNKGVPGITLSYGDVAQSAGTEFRVDTLSKMVETAERYMTDTDFYQSMSEKARARAAVMTDGESALRKVMEKMESSELFF